MRAKIKGFAPRGWKDAAIQIGLFILLYYGYQVVRGMADGKEAVAIANAHRIVDVEHAMGTLFEPHLQRYLIDHAMWLVDFANFMYVNSHFVVTTLFLSWLYFRRNEHFYFVRNMFLVAMGLALVFYALYPTAPPRLLDPSLGFVDTIDRYTGLPQDSATTGYLVNQFAAVPSMHIGFALMIGVPGVVLARSTLVRVWWAAYPLLVFFVVVATGNHYWLDAVAGAAVASVAAVSARQLARARPDHWSWEPAQPSAA